MNLDLPPTAVAWQEPSRLRSAVLSSEPYSAYDVAVSDGRVCRIRTCAVPRPRRAPCPLGQYPMEQQAGFQPAISALRERRIRAAMLLLHDVLCRVYGIRTRGPPLERREP